MATLGGRQITETTVLAMGKKRRQQAPNWVLDDYTTRRMMEVASQASPDVWRGRYMRLAEDTQAGILRQFAQLTLSTEEAGIALEMVLQAFEAAMRRVASRHGRYYLLHLARRILPETVYGERPESLVLSRATLHLAVLKFANDDTSELTSDGLPDHPELRGQYVPVHLTEEDILDIYTLEYLAHGYYMTTSTLRRVWKGAQLRVGPEGTSYEAVEPSQLTKAIEIVDIRTKNHTSLLSSFGLMTGITGETLPPDSLPVLILTLNPELQPGGLQLRRERLIAKDPFRGGDFVSNLLPYGADLRPYYERLKLFEAVLLAHQGLSAEQVVAFLAAMTMWVATSMPNLAFRYQIVQRGWRIIPTLQWLVDELVPRYQYVHSRYFAAADDTTARRHLETILGYVTYRPSDYPVIDLFNLMPIKLLIPVGCPPGAFIVDFLMIPAFLQETFSLSARITGGFGQIKGGTFEHDAAEYVKRHLRAGTFWKSSTLLKFDSGGPPEREMDLSIVVGDLLVVVECKSYGVPPMYERAKPEFLWARREKLVEALRQVDSLARRLAASPFGRNYEVPESVQYIVPLVLSPGVEYVEVDDPSHWLTDDVPRVCTPSELIQVLEQGDTEAFHSKPYTVRVRR